MMHGSPLLKSGAVVALQLILLLSIIGFKQYTIWTGETVLLKTQPVDPRDPFRGDYAIVRYEISRLNTQGIAGDDYVTGKVFVELREDEDNFWEVVAVHNDREREFEDTVLIKGEARHARWGNESGTNVEIEYGIEQVFIPEGSGRQIPASTTASPVAVEVKVDRFGNAVPRRFIVDGEPVDLERR